MKNIIKDVAAKNAVPWGEIAEKIDENFSEVDASFVKGIKVNGSTIIRKNENGVIDIGNLTDTYIVSEFTVSEIVGIVGEGYIKLIISRAFLDAMYRGVPIMVKVAPKQGAAVPIEAVLIEDPSKATIFKFRVIFENIEYVISGNGREVLTGPVTMSVTVTTHNLVDWNEDGAQNPGYIANRTHYLTPHISFRLTQRFTLSINTVSSDIEDYRLKIGDNLYKLPKTKSPVTLGSASQNMKITLTGISRVGTEFISYQYSNSNAVGLSDDVYTVYKLVRPLDSIYLQDEALTWNYKMVRPSDGLVSFNTENTANQLYNKDLVMIDAFGATTKFNIEIGAVHTRPDSVNEYTFIVHNNDTNVVPTVSFVRGIDNSDNPQTKVIGKPSPNGEIHVKLISSAEDMRLAIIEYKPFNS